MKPRIADLEKMAQDYDQALLHSEFYLAPLLCLARAAKAANGEFYCGDEMRAAIDAFDWGEPTAADSSAAQPAR